MRPFANEPPLDFSRDSNRGLMIEAIADAHRRAPRRCPLLIDGEWVETEARIASVNPSDRNELIGEAACADLSHVDSAMAAAQRAFPAWSRTPAERRAEVLVNAAAHLRDRRIEITAWIILEEGKPWHEADGDVCEAIDFLEFYAREMLRLAEPQRLMGQIPGEVNELTYGPLGIAAVIAPWNFPLAIPTGMGAAALVAGNTVTLKPAEQSPVAAQLLGEAIDAAGAPAGAFQLLHGDGEAVGAALVRRPEVDIIAFTGSRPVGLEILREAAVARENQWGIKRTVLELGGKNAIIVDSTADQDAAIPDIVH